MDSGGSGGIGAAAGKVRSRNYDAVASFYELLANAYSFGLIRRAKQVELDYLQPGTRVLYLGVGSGEEAVAAARKGLHVTAVDLSSAMIGRLRRRLRRKKLSAELISGDALRHKPAELYDAVCGNYFFNVFGPADMPVVLRHAASLVRPGGLLMIADMAPPPRGPLGWLSWSYLKLGLSFFWLLRLASQHPIYDYVAAGETEGLLFEHLHDFGPPGGRMPLYRTVILRRPIQAA